MPKVGDTPNPSPVRNKSEELFDVPRRNLAERIVARDSGETLEPSPLAKDITVQIEGGRLILRSPYGRLVGRWIAPNVVWIDFENS